MPNQFDDHLKYHINKLCNNSSPLQLEDFYADTVISMQKVIQCIEEIKKQLVSKPCKTKVTELLLLSAKFEIINSDLIALRHEYNL